MEVNVKSTYFKLMLETFTCFSGAKIVRETVPDIFAGNREGPVTSFYVSL
jgi:hypothetical protein